MSEAILMGNEVLSDSAPHTQVYLATHDGADKRLPYRYRSFISFTYGGKYIEDFNLIATIKNNRMDRKIYGEFNDNTSTYDVLDGQYYWGSHFVTNKLELLLSTDEMEEVQLEEFKNWFRPGPGKELILAEHPNRAIIARINTTPEYHMIPFEKKVQRKLNNLIYEISTTVYRGDIDLEFVMDDPFWYSIYNILPPYGQDGAGDSSYTLAVNGNGDDAQANSLISNKDYLKIILEDGVPVREMFHTTHPVITGEVRPNVLDVPRVGGEGYTGTVATVGVQLATINLALEQPDSAGIYLYYAGSAPAPTILKFDLTPIIENNGYISTPYNKIYNTVAVNSNIAPKSADYNVLNIGSKEFKFTTPSLYTGYNLALNIITSVPEGTSTIDLHILLNEGINEYYSRSWALGILNYLKAFKMGINLETSLIENKSVFELHFKTMMKKFLDILTGGEYESPVYNVMPASFTFNSKTGLSTGTFHIRKFNDEALDLWDKLAKYTDDWHIRIYLRDDWISAGIPPEIVPTYNYILKSDLELTDFWPIQNLDGDYNTWFLYHAGFDMLDNNGKYLFTVKPFMDYTEECYITENVGDMVYDKYLYLDEKNQYNEDGIITETECTSISTDYPAGENNEYGLKNFDLLYKYMYF